MFWETVSIRSIFFIASHHPKQINRTRKKSPLEAQNATKINDSIRRGFTLIYISLFTKTTFSVLYAYKGKKLQTYEGQSVFNIHATIPIRA